jgi:hypothetical protein
MTVFGDGITMPWFRPRQVRFFLDAENKSASIKRVGTGDYSATKPFRGADHTTASIFPESIGGHHCTLASLERVDDTGDFGQRAGYHLCQIQQSRGIAPSNQVPGMDLRGRSSHPEGYE